MAHPAYVELAGLICQQANDLERRLTELAEADRDGRPTPDANAAARQAWRHLNAAIGDLARMLPVSRS